MAQVMRNRMVWAMGSLVAGLLQAWDSNAFVAGGLATVLAVAGIALPAAAIAASAGRGAALAGVITGAVLLIAARVISPVSMNAVHIALFVPAIYVFFVSRLESLSRRSADGA